MSEPWTFERYWRSVLGLGGAEEVVREHSLIPDGLDEWLAKGTRPDQNRVLGHTSTKTVYEATEAGRRALEGGVP